MIGLPFSGHVNPTLGLSKALSENGHKVTFILTKDWQDPVRQTGAKHVQYDDFPDNPTPYQLRRLSFKAAYDTALRVGQGQPFDCFIYEMLFFPGKKLADQLKLPAIRLFSTFALDEQILEQFIDTGGPLMRLFKSKMLRNLITRRLLGGITIENEDLLAEISQNEPDLNFVFTTREFQIDIHKFPDRKFKFIGPSLGAREDKSDLSIKTTPNPLVYISLGSILNNYKTFYRRCVKAFKSEKISVIISTGKKVKAAQLRKIPKNIHIYPSVPQLQVLEKADIFITHGGMNSVNEAMYYGVPMVVIPLATDQPTIAKRIESLNLGKRFTDKTPSAEKIREITLSVLSDKKIASAVTRFKKISRRARGTSFAVREIERYVRRNNHKYNIKSTIKTYPISQKEITRRKRDFAKMLLSLYLAISLSLIDLILINPIPALITLTSTAILFLFSVALTNYTLNKQSKWSVHLTKTQLITAHQTINLNQITHIRIKRTAKNIIRAIGFKLSSGKRITISGLNPNDFEVLNKSIIKQTRATKITDYKESPIDYDHPAWYIIFGTTLGIIFGILIRLFTTADLATQKAAQYAIATFIIITGVFLILKRPTMKEYGTKNKFDLILGPILILVGLVALFI